MSQGGNVPFVACFGRFGGGGPSQSEKGPVYDELTQTLLGSAGAAPPTVYQTWTDVNGHQANDGLDSD